MKLLDALIDEGLARASICAPESMRIHKIVTGASFSTMRSQNIVFQNLFPCTVYLDTAYGFAYGEQAMDRESVFSVMNRDLRDVLSQDRYALPTVLLVALCDALYCAMRSRAPDTFFEGTLDQKAQARAELLLEGIPSGSHLLLLGPVSEIMREATRRGIRVYVTDRSSQKIGKEFFDVTVHPAQSVRALIRKVPAVTHIIATGMILVTDTADEVFETAREKNLHLTLFMETGARMAPALIRRGAARIVAEEFPFYDFQGRTGYCVYDALGN